MANRGLGVSWVVALSLAACDGGHPILGNDSGPQDAGRDIVDAGSHDATDAVTSLDARDAMVDTGTDAVDRASMEAGVDVADALNDTTVDTAASDAVDVPGDIAADVASDAADVVRADAGGDALADVTADSAVDAMIDSGAGDALDADAEAGAPWRHTIMIDGTNDFSATDESFATTSAGYTAYVTWDDSNLFVGYDGADIGSGSGTRWVFVFIDIDPGSGNGATSSPTYNTESVAFPTGFAPEFYLRWKTDNSFQSIEAYSGGAWSTVGTPTTFQSGTYVEFAISLATLGNPASVGVTSLMMNEQSSVEAAYAGLYPDNFVDGYYSSVPLSAYLLADFTSPLAPNTASNRRP